MILAKETCLRRTPFFHFNGYGEKSVNLVYQPNPAFPSICTTLHTVVIQSFLTNFHSLRSCCNLAIPPPLRYLVHVQLRSYALDLEEETGSRVNNWNSNILAAKLVANRMVEITILSPALTGSTQLFWVEKV